MKSRPVAVALAAALAACSSEPDSGSGPEPIAAEWATLVGGAGYQEALAVAIGPDDSIAVVGVFTETLTTAASTLTSDGSLDGFVALFDATGAPRWSRALTGAADDELSAVAFVGDAIVVSGYAGPPAALDGHGIDGSAESSALVARFGADGTLQWQRTFGGDGFQSASDLRPTARGGVIVAGTFTSTLEASETLQASGLADAFVAELDPDGTPLWTHAIGGPGSEILEAVALAADGSIVVSGTSQLPPDPSSPASHGGNVSTFVLGLTAEGAQRWSKNDLFAGVHDHDLDHGAHMVFENPELLSHGSAGDVLVGVTRGAMFGMHGEDFEAPSFDKTTVFSLDAAGQPRWHGELAASGALRLAEVTSDQPLQRLVGSFGGELDFSDHRLRGERPRSLFVVPVLEQGLAAPRPVIVDTVSSDVALTAISASTLSNGSSIVVATAKQADDWNVLLLGLAP